MTNSVSNVVAGKPLVTGGVYSGALGTTLPTDSTTALGAALKAVGYVGDSGVVRTPTRTNDSKKAWGGDIIKNSQTEFSETFEFTMVEARNSEVLKNVYGDANVTITAATSTTGTLYAALEKGIVLPHKVWVFDLADGTGTERIVVEDGQSINRGAVTYSDAEVVAYPVTIQTFRGATTGAFSATYGDDGVHT